MLLRFPMGQLLLWLALLVTKPRVTATLVMRCAGERNWKIVRNKLPTLCPVALTRAVQLPTGPRSNMMVRHVSRTKNPPHINAIRAIEFEAIWRLLECRPVALVQMGRTAPIASCTGWTPGRDRQAAAVAAPAVVASARRAASRLGVRGESRWRD